MKNKRSQLQIQEMSFMLVAVFIFFALVGLFAINIIGSNLKEEARNIKETQTLSSVVRLASSPEFVCVGGRSSCVDVYKVIGLMKSASYRNFWDFSSLIVVRESSFDKSENSMVNCLPDLSNWENCDNLEIYDKKVENEEKIRSYVALCWTEYENYIPYEKCEMGKIIVGREVKELSSLFANPIQYLMQMFGGIYDSGENYGNQCKNPYGGIKVGQSCEINGESGYCDENGKCIIGEVPLVPIKPADADEAIVPINIEPINPVKRGCEKIEDCGECEVCDDGKLSVENQISKLDELNIYIRNVKEGEPIKIKLPLFNPDRKSRQYLIKSITESIKIVSDSDLQEIRPSVYYFELEGGEEKKIEILVNPKKGKEQIYFKFGPQSGYLWARSVFVHIMDVDENEESENLCIGAIEKNWIPCNKGRGVCRNGECEQLTIQNTEKVISFDILFGDRNNPINKENLKPELIEEYKKIAYDLQDSLPDTMKQSVKGIRFHSDYFIRERFGGESASGYADGSGSGIITLNERREFLEDVFSKEELQDSWMYKEDIEKPEKERRNLAMKPKYGLASGYGAQNSLEDVAEFVQLVIFYPNYFRKLLDASNPWHEIYQGKLDLLYEYGFITYEEYNSALSGESMEISLIPYSDRFRHESSHTYQYYLRTKEKGGVFAESSFDKKWNQIANSKGSVYMYIGNPPTILNPQGSVMTKIRK